MKKLFTFLPFLFFNLVIFAQNNTNSETALAFQERLNKEFADSISSPLTKEDRKVFKKLDFYPINERFRVKATFVKIKKGKIFEMKTSTKRLPKYRVFGVLHFELEGKSHQLQVYQSIDLVKNKKYKTYLFLPFTDFTNGNETYGAGRYIDLRIPKDNFVIIDFNKAYNPYCAYNKDYSCPIVPEENDLKIEINAGVKKFHD